MGIAGKPKPARAGVCCLLASTMIIGTVDAAAADGDFSRALRRKVFVEGAGHQRYSIEERMKHYGVPGVSVAVVDKCQVVEARSFGAAAPDGRQVTRETLFQAGSVSKVVAAAGALKLVEQGALDLDVDISTRISGWRPTLRGGEPSPYPLTLRSLLSHGAGLTVAGFKGYPVGTSLPTLTAVLTGSAPANTAPVQVEGAPGAAWRYSGGGFVVAQLLIEQRTSERFSDLMTRLVLQPAGMAHSTYRQPLDAPSAKLAATGTLADGSPIPGGWRLYPEQAAAGLWSTPTDLSKFGIELMRSTRGEAGALLRRDTALEMMRPQQGSWGLGLDLTAPDGARKISHTGAPIGYRSLWLMYPDHCQGATIMTNADEGMTLAYEVARALADTYGWPEHLASERTSQIAADKHVVDRFVGSYQLRDFPEERFDVTIRGDGRLTWSRQGRGHRDLVAVTEQLLISPDSGMTLRIVDQHATTRQAQVLELGFPGGVNVALRIR